MSSFRIEKADPPHKWVGIFTDKDGDETRVKFGASGYDDLTISKDRRRKSLYLARHRTRENWNDPKTAGSLSRWILWNTPNLEQNVRDFKKRFNLD
jgi:hypothetical protein